ncbi:MAG TPA: DUF924 family protein [Thermohalobaculum sp.]|nr:DUF924 family protein [Thermohalobaculum sp.]
MTTRSADQIEEILRLWLDEVGPKGWYERSVEVDKRVTEGYRTLWAKAVRGDLDHWMLTPRGALALLILLDQFPRNMFRGSADAFVGDDHARAMAKLAVVRGHDLAIPEPARQFFYLPLMHSEALADQEQCVRLVKLRLPESGQDNLDHAVRHREVIRRFGRFPSRNRSLGRRDTEAERRYREQGGYMSGAGAPAPA